VVFLINKGDYIMAFEYSVDPNFDYTIDEKGNTFIALRKIDWNNSGNYKLDIRKYYASEEGEKMAKGVSFLTEDGPDELTKVLLETGYGNDEEIANTILENRKGILARIAVALNDPEKSYDLNIELEQELEDDEFYDPEELIA
jgi:hypothetical protein